ncbi:MAG TPA: LytR C-terminal domain-containing protein [Alphaproteobacteria bacterium]
MRLTSLRIIALSTLAGACSGIGPDLELRPVASQPFAQPGADAEARGKAHLAAGNYGLAVQDLRAALRRRPDSVEILNALAVAYDLLGRSDLAQSYFAQALAYQPDSLQTLNNLARLHLRHGEVEQARVHLERAAALARDHADPALAANLDALAALEAERQAASRAGTAPAAAAAGPFGRVERTDLGVQTIVTTLPPGSPPPAHPPAIVVPIPPAETTPAAHAPAPQPDRTAPPADPPPKAPLALAPGASVVPASFTAPPTRAAVGKATFAIVNGNGRTRMAARLKRFLENRGWTIQRLRNADHYRYADTLITYRPGHAAAAARLAAELPTAATLQLNPRQDVDVSLRFGRDLADFDVKVLLRSARQGDNA